jgi:outer membrane protein assembly factor BamA
MLSKIFSGSGLWFLLCLGIVGFAQVQDVHQGKLVEEVELRGYRSVSTEELLQRVQTKPGGKYEAAQVKRDLEQLLALGIFDRARCKVVVNAGPRGGVVVSFLLKELSEKKD